MTLCLQMPWFIALVVYSGYVDDAHHLLLGERLLLSNSDGPNGRAERPDLVGTCPEAIRARPSRQTFYKWPMWP